MFVMHFVEGLPDNDVRIYTFTFEGKRYSVTTVIQYKQELRHFVTWICNCDGRYFKADSFMGLLHFLTDMTCEHYISISVSIYRHAVISCIILHE